MTRPEHPGEPIVYLSSKGTPIYPIMDERRKEIVDTYREWQQIERDAAAYHRLRAELCSWVEEWHQRPASGGSFSIHGFKSVADAIEAERLRKAEEQKP